MARIVYSRRALDDLERLVTFLASEDPQAAQRSAVVIASAIDTLAEHPLIGRIRRGDVRELVISFGKTGYVALYRFVPHAAELRVLAVRRQRDLDYPR